MQRVSGFLRSNSKPGIDLTKTLPQILKKKYIFFYEPTKTKLLSNCLAEVCVW